MRLLTTLIELLGFACLIAGLALIYVPAAFIAAGLGLILISWAVAPRNARKDTP
jgi:hypothetical protein